MEQQNKMPEADVLLLNWSCFIVRCLLWGGRSVTSLLWIVKKNKSINGTFKITNEYRNISITGIAQLKCSPFLWESKFFKYKLFFTSGKPQVLIPAQSESFLFPLSIICTLLVCSCCSITEVPEFTSEMNFVSFPSSFQQNKSLSLSLSFLHSLPNLILKSCFLQALGFPMQSSITTTSSFKKFLAVC